jgi:DNA-binding CsgD family transcriptional regulator
MLDLDKLAKIWALTDSPNRGEAAAARNRAEALLKAHGKTIADVPEMLRQRQSATDRASAGGAPEPGQHGFTFYDMNNPEHMAAWAESDRTRRAERARKEAPEREAVISRYGSVDAAIDPCEREVLLRMSVRKWAIFHDAPNQRWTKSIDGSCELWIREMKPRVRLALSIAYPLPQTVQEAKTEYDYWECRDRELGLVLEDTRDTQLDLAARGRREIVLDLLETGLRARTLGEVLIRQRYIVARECSMPEVEQAILADLEHLAAMAERAPAPAPAPEAAVQTGRVHNGQRETATDRRAEVIRLLSNVDTAHLSDREIARQVGVSPQTVGNLRRRLADEKLAEAA